LWIEEQEEVVVLGLFILEIKKMPLEQSKVVLE